jgi:hypothetical protein
VCRACAAVLLDAAVAQPAAKQFHVYEEKFSAFSPNQCGTDIVCQGTNSGAGVAMRYRSELVPLAVMGSLTAAIMIVFAVTVMH